MAFKLDKGDGARRDGYVEELRKKELAVHVAVEQFNERVAVLREELIKAVEDYNETLSEARGFVEDTASAAESAIDDKSEKWQESDRGQAASEWQSAWADIELEDIEVPDQEELTIEAPGHADEIEGLPAEADMPS